MTRLRQLWLVTALVSVAALAGGYFLLVSPKANEAAAIREEAETQVTANKKLANDIAQLKQQAKDLPKKQAELAQFARQIPPNPALPQLIRSLTDAADNAGVELASVAPGEPQLAAPAAAGTTATATAAQAVAQIPVNLQVSGTYSALTQFFSEIESLPRAFLVSGVTVAPGKAGGPSRSGSSTAGSASAPAWTGDLTATLNGRLFMTTTPQAAAKPATAPAGDKESS
jgi:Tfp pilus assembly protein PilO